MTTPYEARSMIAIRTLNDFLSRRVELVYPHPRHGERGMTTSHQTDNGKTWLVVEMDSGDDLTITDAKQLWFLTGATIPAEG